MDHEMPGMAAMRASGTFAGHVLPSVMLFVLASC